MTPRVLWLSAGVQAAVPIAQPRLDQLSEQIGRSTPLCILDGAEIVYLAPSGTSA
jgi:IclR family transcriptional regulator, pca regulon regulatory protein